MSEIQLATMADLNSKVLTDVPANAKFTDTVYTHPTSAGNKHIPTGGATGQILKYSASGTAVWGDEKDTIYTHPETHPASMITGLPTSLPANGGNAATVGGFTVGVSVPANAKFTDTVYTHPTSHAASMITFDNTVSGLTAITLQEAINELKALIDGLGA